MKCPKCGEELTTVEKDGNGNYFIEGKLLFFNKVPDNECVVYCRNCKHNHLMLKTEFVMGVEKYVEL